MKTPSLESAAEPKTGHVLHLVAQKAPLPPKLLQATPAHLKDHAALKGDRGAKLALHAAYSTLVFGIGKAQAFDAQEASEYGENAGRWLRSNQISEVHVVFPPELKDRHAVFAFLKGLMLSNHALDELKTPHGEKPALLERVTYSGGASSSLKKPDCLRAQAIARGIAHARDLIELPPNVATPAGVASRFKRQAPSSLELELWDEKKIAKEGMGLLEAVARGSSEPPRFLIARYGKDLKPAKKGAPLPHLFLVGKGVTFDTGGVNLKISGWTDLLWMKKDMAGAAAVLGAMLAIAELKPGIRITAVTPLTFNSLGSTATLPGEVVKAYSGKTVEIMNTDAEGRLILADALHYAVKNGATQIVDVATLTGACQVALGEVHSGAFFNSAEFGKQVVACSTVAGEPAWPMPMSPRYGEELKSKIADLANMGKTRNGGATLGAKFLERFVGQTPWCHLDIAGAVDLTAAAGDVPVPAAGRMVHTLVELAEQLA